MDSNPNDKVTEPGKCRRRCFKIPFFILGIVLVKSAIVMLLWNALVPDLFHGPVVDYLQAAGLVILAKLLFGFGFRHGHGHGRFGPPWKHWAGLSPEERLKLREEMRNRCGG